MIRPAAHLLDEALRLPESERAELAARLIESLDPAGDVDADADSEAAWNEELRRRLEELDKGQVRAVSWAEARQRIMDDAD